MEKLLLHPNLDIFKQHGFLPKQVCSDGVNVSGTCLFCGSYSAKLQKTKNTFFVNTSNKRWDCKMCGLEGGYETFLQELQNFGQLQITNSLIKDLAAEKSIDAKTLIVHKVGYNPLINRYYVPVFAPNKTVVDLKIYNPDSKARARFISSVGANKSLYFGYNYDRNNPIYLTEGEWDRMVMWETLVATKSKGSIVGLPGATSLKTEWINYFKGMDVIVLLDNDYDREVQGKLVEGAGKKGSQKIYRMLKGVSRSLKFLRWPEKLKLKDGFDIRDLKIYYKGNYEKIIEFVYKYLQDEPEHSLQATQEESSPVCDYGTMFDGKGCSISKVHKVFSKHLLFKNTNAIDITLATLVANRFPGSPVWLFLVGASGSGKSEIFMSLGNLRSVELVSSLTPHVLISGATNYSGSADPSLVPRINGRILGIKDFTTIMGMCQTNQNEIIATLRDCFDGSCAKPFGNGRQVKYDSKFGLIAGVTHIIDHFSEDLTSLGERFIRYNIELEQSEHGENTVLWKVITNITSGTKSVMQDELKEVMTEFLDYDFKPDIVIDKPTTEKVIALAQWTGLMRGTILRDKRSTEIIYKPMVEYSTRLTEQLFKVLMALHVIYREKTTNPARYETLKSVARSTVPVNHLNVMAFVYHRELDYKHGGQEYLEVSGGEIIERIGLPAITVRKHIDNLTMLGLLKKIKLERMDKFGSRSKYRLTDKANKLIQKSEIFDE